MMMFQMKIMILAGLASGLFSYILNYSHLLNSLLSLEFLVVIIYWWLSLSVLGSSGNLFFILFYLVMVVCESVLGLSLFIGSAYSHGSDYMKMYSSLTC
uniref:NADH dehydrogenase subunit 4L n=1 Tax=Gammarus lacustris TaxID=52639 RepID=A0A517LS45_9CRUS|nr:NADH dehydrogenase subunit 4L [Gammarus lacustris]QDS78459.1 NADH dehydrogenase subunit 4L [Gammarus lacustris]